ncbi:hypothetical protein ABW20_dc0106996 [Dactylellina cionopaga]|nr:hypothetical protein ABW20_dc0106996 [Dactylellina cionopaga]
MDPSNNMMMPSSMDPLQFQQQQQQQFQHSPVSQQQPPHASLMHNGNARHPSPGFQTPSYHVNPVVPLKRARPREDSVNISPRQTTGVLPSSRSQTPQGGVGQVPSGQMYHLYGAGNPNVPQRPLSATPSFIPQLGQGAPNNGTPSPIMQSQVYKTPNTGTGASASQPPPPKRMATQSPSPFSPANQQHMFIQQGSPNSEHSGTRSVTPHGFSAQPSPGFNPGFAMQPQRAFSPPNAPGAPINVPQNFQGNPQAQAMYNQMQRQHQHKMMQQSAQMQTGQNQMMQQHSRNMPVSTLPGSHPNPNAKISGRGVPNPDQFARSLQDFMQKRGTPIASLTPHVGERQMHLFTLYLQVQRFGGHRSITANNQWTSVAQSMQVNTDAHPGIPDQLAQIYQANLAPFEDAYRKSTQAQQPVSGSTSNMLSHQNLGKQSQIISQSPTKQQPQEANAANYQGPSSNGFHTQNTSFQQNIPHNKPISNATTHSSFLPAVAGGALPFNPNQISSKAVPVQSVPAAAPAQLSDPSQQVNTPTREKHDLHFKPKVRGLDTHGGVDVAVLSGIGTEIVHLRPTVPTFNELGIIDVHALTMSLKSGLQAEVRLALDTLVTVSVESQWSLSLKSCEDLVETLVDVAESEVLLLRENAAELETEPLFPPYEEVLRGCRQEANTLLAVPRVGSRLYELDRAADRLIAITTIFRNLSFFESNHDPLAESSVIKFVASVIDIMCKTKMLLRSNNNTLDFMKDMIIFLSNLSQSIILPGKQEALGLLRFILSFAPQPGPFSSGRMLPMFASYHPSVHRYLPPAVDSLAKLLVRDEPNRGYFKELFSAEPGTGRPWDLLTRSFALAISPIPVADNVRMMLPQAVEARKPYLEQGMLAAEILSGIAALEDSHLALSWLSSEDGFSHSLVRLVYFLSTQQQLVRPMGNRGVSYQDDAQPFSRVIQRGAIVLRNLSMTSSEDHKYGGLVGSIESLNLLDTEADSLKTIFLAGMASKKEILFGALMNQSMDAKALSSMCEFTGFGGGDIDKDDIF